MSSEAANRLINILKPCLDPKYNMHIARTITSAIAMAPDETQNELLHLVCENKLVHDTFMFNELPEKSCKILLDVLNSNQKNSNRVKEIYNSNTYIGEKLCDNDFPINKIKKMKELLANENQIMPSFYDNVNRNSGNWWLFRRGANFKSEYDWEVDKEKIICEGINAYWITLMNHIKNPSENVIITAISRHSDYFKSINKPTKNMIIAYVVKKDEEFAKYEKQFSETEIETIVEKNPNIIKHIANQSEKLCWIALKRNLKTIEFVKNQTDEMCEYVTDINSFPKESRHYDYPEKIIANLKKFNDKVVKNIMYNHHLIGYFRYVPEKYRKFTVKDTIYAIKLSPYFIKFVDEKTQDLCNLAYSLETYKRIIEHIPAEFQTEMIIYDTLNQSYHNLQYVHNKTKEFCEFAFAKNIDAIKYIPLEFQTKEMCMKAIEKSISNLEYCMVIDNDIMHYVFYVQPIKQRTKRFNFIVEAARKMSPEKRDEYLSRVISVRRGILGCLTDDEQTETLIKTALKIDGYALRYIKNKKPEYIKLALEMEPKAVKYAP
jgi:N-glycosylase/DNA lyase